ncbi:GNAT family N-acetyltransferase [Flavobacterium humi]|uniref:N-acetyltransferase n=1 Tax=Flavobacterium humi TaxID=2562683 RepID=A0A4Z0LCU6_9FLAO|nr:GNAT family N-acetyltransferase [Flavobacterium humi]TGD59710.1 N-acetyltransferase [Flavobacterium humi]
MKPEYTEIKLFKNEKDHQFEITVNGYKALIVYKEQPGIISLIHTEAAPELEGKGAATAVIEKTLDYIEANKYTLIPLCPLVFAYIKRHPEWKRIVDKSFKGFEQS